MKHRKVKLLPQGHTATYNRAKVQTQDAVCCMCQLCRLLLSGCCTREGGQSRAEDRHPRIPSRRQEDGGLCGAHPHGGLLTSPVLWDQATWASGQAQPERRAQGHQVDSRASLGTGYCGSSLGSRHVPSKLPQITRPPLLPQSPHCSLYPAPARLCPPLGLAHTVPSAWRAPP